MAQAMQISADLPARLRFGFESDAAASFLVMNCDARVLEYQALMLEHNRIRYVLPVDVVVREGMSCFYYNITSKISLSFLIARRKLNREEFLKLLLNIASAVNTSAGYLLTASNFVFDPEYIYVSPETLDPMLVYVPAALDDGSGTTLQTFISDLLLHHINADGFSCGNFVQRVLSEVKSDLFSIKSLILVINDLLYIKPPDGIEFSDAEETSDVQAAPMTCGEKPNAVSAMKAVPAMKASTVVKTSPLTVLAILAQILMGIAIYTGRNFLNNVSENPTATYAAVVMIVLAIDMLIFRKLNAAKLIRIEKGQESHAGQDNYPLQNASVETLKDSGAVKNHLQGKAGPPLSSTGKIPDTDHYAVRKAAYPKNREAACKVVSEAADEAAATATVSAMTASAAASAVVSTVPSTPSAAVSNTALAPALTAAPVMMRPVIAASGKTELLSNRVKGARMLKSTGRKVGDEDIFITSDDFIIGRLAEHVDHVINNNAVGKLHAQLLSRNGTCYIKDLNSVNGTFVNSRRIECNKEIELKENDRVLLANCEFVYVGG